MFPSGPPTVPPPLPIPPIPPPPVMIEQAFQQQIQSLQERLRQSEVNLAAQHESIQLAKKVRFSFSFQCGIELKYFRIKFKKIFILHDKHVFEHRPMNVTLI